MVRNDASRDSIANDRDENDLGGHATMTNGHDNEVEMTASDINNNNNNNESNNGETELLIPTGGENDTAAKIRGARKSSSTSTTLPGNTAIPARRKVRRVVKNDASSSIGSSNADKEENAQAICIKYSALFLLVAQMVGLVLLMRYSRVASSTNNDKEPLYLASTAVFVMEVMKLFICFGVVFYQMSGNLNDFVREIHHHTISAPVEMMKLTIPSLLYTVQNNLLYLALTNLDAATYQVCYQLKILTTALFSAVLLQRTFSCMKWISLIVLTVGVAIVQLSGSSDSHQHAANADHHEAVRALADQTESHNRFIGLVAVICAACTSGFSGVYFEKILKGSRTSLWIRNVQMGLPSVLIAYMTVYIQDAAAVKLHGFFGGYNTIVWTVIVVQAVGGLIVATVVKYADNVLKVFATSFSIIISCIISAFFFDFHPTFSFLVGAGLVVTATVMYSAPERKPRRKSILPTTRAK